MRGDGPATHLTANNGKVMKETKKQTAAPSKQPPKPSNLRIYVSSHLFEQRQYRRGSVQCFHKPSTEVPRAQKKLASAPLPPRQRKPCLVLIRPLARA